MASHIKKGESLLIPFRNGQSISDSQLKPRMYKTMQAFEKSFPGHYLGTDGVELVEYAPVVRCEKCIHSLSDGWICGGAGFTMPSHPTYPNSFCSDGERRTDERKAD